MEICFRFQGVKSFFLIENNRLKHYKYVINKKGSGRWSSQLFINKKLVRKKLDLK